MEEHLAHEPVVIVLGDVLDLKAASGLHAELSQRRGQALTIDASQVQRLGAQCLQVVLAANLAWQADGVSLSITRPSKAFCDALDLFGARLDGIGELDLQERLQ